MSEQSHYEGTPGGTDRSGALVQYEAFEHELNERAQSIATMLPSTLSIDRFKNTVIAAIRQDPDILKSTVRSVMAAVVRAAQDGLVPDGREGHISSYNTNVAKKGEKDRWEKRAQWNPMAHGLRKRLRELDGIIANAEVVHENDLFVWHQGDDPKIEHQPAKLGTPRGPMIGSYCIYKREDGTILHREVMDKDQVEATRAQSKAPNSLMWTKFVSEGCRKSVLRRGVKTVPVCDTMREIIRRDDEENFDFSKTAEPALTLVPPSPPAIEHKQTVPMPDLGLADTEPVVLTDEETRALDRQSMRDMRGETAPHNPETGEIIENEPPAGDEPETKPVADKWRTWFDTFKTKVEASTTPVMLSKVLQSNANGLEACETEAPELGRLAMQAYRNKAATMAQAPVTDARGLT